MAYQSKDEIKTRLDAAGIDYDGGATREDLLALLPDEDEGASPAEKPKGKTVKMRLLRDYWPEEGQRIRKGTEVDMEPEDAMDAMERDFAERVK